jgi:hypothetical protein
MQLMVALTALLVFAIAASACSPAAVPYRRTALVPMPAANVRLGRALEPGELRASGHIAAGPVGHPSDPLYPGDPMLAVPRASLGASFFGGLTRHVELGVAAEYSPEALVRSRAVENPFPVTRRASTGRLVAGLRLNALVSRRITLALSAESGLSFVPQMHYFCPAWDETPGLGAPAADSSVTDGGAESGSDGLFGGTAATDDGREPCTYGSDFVPYGFTRHAPWYGNVAAHLVVRVRERSAFYVVIRESAEPRNIGLALERGDVGITLAPATTLTVGGERAWNTSYAGVHVSLVASSGAAAGVLIGVQAGWRRPGKPVERRVRRRR